MSAAPNVKPRCATCLVPLEPDAEEQVTLSAEELKLLRIVPEYEYRGDLNPDGSRTYRWCDLDERRAWRRVALHGEAC